MKVMSHTGLSLDPDFTMKAVKGMLNEMKERPEIFKGRRVLFLHSGKFVAPLREVALQWNLQDPAFCPL